MMDWESGISRCKLFHTGWINKVLLYSTGNYIQYPLLNYIQPLIMISHNEIKRRLLLGKVMTNLDSIFRNRDIILLTKVRLVKAMAFALVTYGCESWTVKKAERQRIDAFELWCWKRLLRVP